MKKRILVILGLVVLLISLVAACAQPAPAPAPAPKPAPAPSPTPAPAPTPTTTAAPTPTLKPVQLVFTDYNAEGTDPGILFKAMAPKITQRTNGAVTFKMYFGGTYGGPNEVLPYSKVGMVDIADIGLRYYPALFPLSTVGNLPYSGLKMDARTNAFVALLTEYPQMQYEFASQNVKLMTPLFGNESVLGMKTKKIETMADFKGLKLRATGLEAEAVSAWGGTPVALDMGDIFDAQSRGLIDGTFGLPPQTLVVVSLQTVSKYFVDPGVGPTSVLAFVMNNDKYKSLQPEVQKILDEEFTAAIGQYTQVRMDAMKASIPKVLDAKTEVYSVTGTTATDMQTAAGKRVQDYFVQSVIKAGGSEAVAKKMIARYIELYKQFEPKSIYKPFVQIYNENKK